MSNRQCVIFPMVSVIIPVYNGESYIENCLNSIKEQGDISTEIILVDDGSTDNSLKIISEFQIKNEDLNINVISQQNMGQGAARNKGIEHAAGKYICFVDQDDTLPKQVIKKLADQVENKKCDVVISGYQRVTEAGSIKRKVTLKNCAWSKYRIIAPWAKLYKREFLMHHNIRFLPVALGEDIYFMMRLYAAQPRIVVDNGIGYNWLDSSVSVSNTVHKKISNKTSLLVLFDKLNSIEGITELNRDRMFEYFLLKTAVWDMLYTVKTNSREDIIKNATAIWNWMKNYYPDCVQNPYLPVFRLKGENITIRMIVSTFVFLHRIGLDIKLLCFLNRVIG